MIHAPNRPVILGPPSLGIVKVRYATPSAVVATLAFRETLVAKLGSISALTTLVGTAIYPDAIPQTRNLSNHGPALTYRILTYNRHHVLAGSDGTATARVELSAWADTLAAADAIALALWDALDGPPVNPWAAGGITILSCSHAGEFDMPAQPRDGSDRWTYRIASQYQIKHRTSIPSLS